MPLTKPLGNNTLVEVMRDDDGVSRTDDNESMQFGKLIGFSIDNYHLTASAAVEFSQAFIQKKTDELNASIGQIVRWEEFAEGGQTFKEDGKTYASIPFWRLITTKENTDAE